MLLHIIINTLGSFVTCGTMCTYVTYDILATPRTYSDLLPSQYCERPFLYGYVNKGDRRIPNPTSDQDEIHLIHLYFHFLTVPKSHGDNNQSYHSPLGKL